ncbi:MAG: hypothetical protein ACRDHP_11135 [Ktedonobacterales bacterium]
MSQIAPERTLTEEVADFLARGPSAEEVASFRISDFARDRIATLMEKNESGALTADESTELDEITVLDQLFTLIRARTASRLAGPALDDANR